jgi:Tat protein secretion system quality control protein TatD with DNase activity
VAAECKRFAGRIPAFLFHGFSRSDGLLPDIAALNGFVSVGPAVLNDHAVNYRKLVVKIPAERLLVETDRTAENAAECPAVEDIARKLAELRGISYEELEALTDMNVRRFCGEC